MSRAKKVSTDAGKSSRQGDHNFTQVSLTCSHTAALVPVPTSHVRRTILHSSRRVHRRAGCPGLLASRCSPDGHIGLICNRCALTSQHAPTRCHLSLLGPLKTARLCPGDGIAVDCRERSLVATGERHCPGDHKEGGRAGRARPPCRPCAGPKPRGGVPGCMLDYSHARLHLDPVISSGRIRYRGVCAGRCWGRPLDGRISAGLSPLTMMKYVLECSQRALQICHW